MLYRPCVQKLRNAQQRMRVAHGARARHDRVFAHAPAVIRFVQKRHAIRIGVHERREQLILVQQPLAEAQTVILDQAAANQMEARRAHVFAHLPVMGEQRLPTPHATHGRMERIVLLVQLSRGLVLVLCAGGEIHHVEIARRCRGDQGLERGNRIAVVGIQEAHVIAGRDIEARIACRGQSAVLARDEHEAFIVARCRTRSLSRIVGRTVIDAHSLEILERLGAQ